MTRSRRSPDLVRPPPIGLDYDSKGFSLIDRGKSGGTALNQAQTASNLLQNPLWRASEPYAFGLTKYQVPTTKYQPGELPVAVLLAACFVKDRSHHLGQCAPGSFTLYRILFAFVKPVVVQLEFSRLVAKARLAVIFAQGPMPSPNERHPEGRERARAFGPRSGPLLA